MPLPRPTLDNRRHDQLVSEGRALIPRLAPQWTDHNAYDPGITLLELGAWLAEQNIYRFDRVSDEARLAFVRLVGIEPHPPIVAQTVVALGNTNPAGLALPARLQLAAAGAPLFETTQAVFASPAQLLSVATGGTSPLDVTADNASLTPFAAFGTRPRPGHAFYLGFDRALDAAGERLSLHVWSEHWSDDAKTQAALQAEQAALAAHAGPSCPPSDWRRHYRVRCIWEFHAGANHWLPLGEVEDGTRALSLSGFVRFAAPVGHQSGSGGLFHIRCRILRGRFECPPRLCHVILNAVTCEHALSIAEQMLDVARGHAGAVFDLGRAPVVAGSIRLRLDDGAGGIQSDWREVADFEQAGPFDKVFVAAPERGLLQSGDGRRGAILPAGYQLSATFQTGGGVDGNIGSRQLSEVPANVHNLGLQPALAGLAGPLAVNQPFAASGGQPHETLAAAQARAYDSVCAVDKAVTLTDIERLALGTPGVPVARVRAVAGLDGDLPCYPAPSVISLIVIPPCPKRGPLPSQALLDAVERYLEPRRLVTSEIHALAPRYRRIGVNATLHLACDADMALVLRAAAANLDAFLDPLSGGPDGSGWPFGRTVYRSEIMALLAAVPGVDRVTAFSLVNGWANSGVAAGGCGCTENVPVGSTGNCDNIELCPHELVLAGRHQLVVESDRASNLKRSNGHECKPI